MGYLITGILCFTAGTLLGGFLRWEELRWRE